MSGQAPGAPSAIPPVCKLLVIGSSGAGKSTLARRIAELTGLPLIHLDALYWSPGWQVPERAQWRAQVAELVERPAWVMDGNYGDTLPMRLAACDAVVFLDLQRWRCLWRIVRRRVQFHGRGRPDMGPGCPERLSWALVRFVLGYRRTRRPGILRQLALARSQGKAVFVLSRPGQVERFVQALPVPAGNALEVSPPPWTPGG
ncbi:MAG: hypothetical protein QM601_11005 [Pseudoxanthomonas sp.]